MLICNLQQINLTSSTYDSWIDIDTLLSFTSAQPSAIPGATTEEDGIWILPKRCYRKRALYTIYHVPYKIFTQTCYCLTPNHWNCDPQELHFTIFKENGREARC